MKYQLKYGVPPKNPLTLWYLQPGTLNTQLNKANDNLPIGNGRLAAMIQGGIISEAIQLNEESLWSGGPNGKEQDADRADSQVAYNFGYNQPSPNHAVIYDQLKYGASGYNCSNQGVDIEQIQGNYHGYGKYKTFGSLNIEYMNHSGAKDYRRELDLTEGVARVTYTIGDTYYTREYIASHPDNAIAVRICAHNQNGDNGRVSVAISYTPGQSRSKVTARNGAIIVTGTLQDNGLMYSGIFKTTHIGGTIQQNGNTTIVKGASSVIIYFTAATDYKNEYELPADSKLFEKLTYRTGETLQQISNRLQAIVIRLTAEGFIKFYNRHQADYQALFSRVDFNLGGENSTPTDIALKAYASGNAAANNAHMLEALLYQYGRYLLISSSRKGSLPANLQGKWNPENQPPWSADYHTNINLQMNYWPAGGANLLETLEPLAKFTKSLMLTGRYTAQKYNYATNTSADDWKTPGTGWTTHVSGGIFGFTAPGYSWDWGWAPTAGAWIAQNLYQYIQYGGCTETFKNDYWPIIREAAVMWTKSLYKAADGLWAGKYVVVPSFSPEHGPLTVATATEQQLVHEIFTIALNCMDSLNLSDPESVALRTNIEEKLANLYPGVNISPTTGRIMEWTESTADFDNDHVQTHRHINHLVGFYPCTSIANGDPANLQAVINTLNWKGDDATGWSMGWKLNLWARTGMGDRAYNLVQNLFKHNLALNMFDLHGGIPFSADGYYFQIDGNFGYTSGVQEMLLHSHLGSLDLLPALPSQWTNGHIRGIRSIGGHEVDMKWECGKLTNAAVKAFSDGIITLRNKNFDKVYINNKELTASNGAVTINVCKDITYKIVLT